MEKVTSREELDSRLLQDANCVYIVKMGAEWCAPCQRMDTPLQQLSNELASSEHNATFLSVDRTDDTEDMFETHEITVLPTLLLFKDGNAVEKLPRPELQVLRDAILKLLPGRKLVLDDDF